MATMKKRCPCPPRTWPRCVHSYYFNFMWRGERYRFPVDEQAGRHIAALKDASHLADGWRRDIRDGRFVPYDHGPAVAEAPAAAVVFSAFAALWVEHAREDVGASQRDNDRGCIARLTRLLGDAAIDTLTVDRWEGAFRRIRTSLSLSSYNKYRQAVLLMQEWGVEQGYLSGPWLAGKILKRRGTLRRVKESHRYRRLAPEVVGPKGVVVERGEQQRLLAHADVFLERLIVAALETAMRAGELLALQWRDVSLHRREVIIRAQEEGARKTRQPRHIPLSDEILGLLHGMERDPDGERWPGTAYVFGDGLGGKRVFPKKSWETLVLKAHGVTPAWVKGRGKLDSVSRARVHEIDLHFHDLRREGACRMLERGWPLSHVQAILGHESIETTSRYLSVTLHQLQESMQVKGTGGQSVQARTNSRSDWHKLSQTVPRELPPLVTMTRGKSRKAAVN